jgi:hypothetical protein
VGPPRVAGVGCTSPPVRVGQGPDNFRPVPVCNAGSIPSPDRPAASIPNHGTTRSFQEWMCDVILFSTILVFDSKSLEND